jgi:hemoglobin-like flavoprotein
MTPRPAAFGDTSTRGTEEAWRTAYRVLATTMQSNTKEKTHAGQPAAS